MDFNYENLQRGEPLWDEKVNKNFQKLKDFIDDTMTSKASPADVTIYGHTLMNRLGKDGNPTYQRKWVASETTNPAMTYDNNKFNLKVTKSKFYGNYLNSKLKANSYYLIVGRFNDNNPVTKGKYNPVAVGPNTSRVDRFNITDWDLGIGVDAFKTAATQATPNQHSCIIGACYGTTEMTTTDVVDLTVWDVRMYILNQAQYDEIKTMTAYEIDKLYPYVDDIRGIVNPYIESVENLCNNNTFYQGSYMFENNPTEWWLPVFDDNDEYVCNQSAIELTPGTYTLNGEFNGDDVKLYAHVGKVVNSDTLGVEGTFTITEKTMCTIVLKNNVVGATADSAAKILNKLRSGEYRVTLVKGDTPKLYNNCMNSRIMFETTLYEGEVIRRQDDGTYVKDNQIIELTDFYKHDFTVKNSNGSGKGFKYIGTVDRILPEDTLSSISGPVGVKYDGSIMTYDGLAQSADTFIIYTSDNTVHPETVSICVSNKDSGWGENYIPTTDEIRAYLLGWVMYDNSEAGKCKIYNRTDGLNKKWAKIWCGSGDKSPLTMEIVDVVNGSSMLDCPRHMNDQGYTQYRLYFNNQLTTLKEVRTHGSLMVSNNIDVRFGSGLVLNENALVSYSNESIFTGAFQTKFKYKCDHVVKIIDDESRYVPFKSTYLTNPKDINLYGISYPILTTRDINNMKLDEGSKSLYVDYYVYRPDTVTSYIFDIKKSDNVLETLNKVGHELTQLYQRIGLLNQELMVAELELAGKINPNLLINPDFKINQRNKKTYATAQYSVDRWYFSNGETLNVVDDGIQFVSTADTKLNRIEQRIENFKELRGKTLSFAVNVKASDGNKVLLIYDAGDGWKEVVTGGYKKGIVYGTFTVPTNATKLTVAIQGEGIRNYTIGWAKLEVGSTQTAFVSPDTSTELIKCRRYYEAFNVDNYTFKRIYNAFTFAANIFTLNGSIAFNIPKRVNPTVSMVYNINDGAFVTTTPSTITNLGFTDTTISVPSTNYVDIQSWTADAEMY